MRFSETFDSTNTNEFRSTEYKNELQKQASNGELQLLLGQPIWLSRESYSLALLVFSAMLYSLMSTFIKLAALTGIPSNELVFIRGIFQGFFVVLALFLFRDEETGKRLIWLPYGSAEVRMIVLARGIIGGCGFLCFYFTISSLPLGDATTLLSLNPILTVVAAPLFLKEPVHASHIFAAIASLVGCIFIAKPTFLFPDGGAPPQHRPSTYNPTGYLTALMGASCAATVYILIRRAGKAGVHTVQLLFSWVTFGVIFSLVFSVAFPAASGLPGGTIFLRPSTRLAWIYVLGTCTFGMLGHVLLNYAARHAPAGLSSIMRASGILWSYVLELVVFEQFPQRSTFMGVLLIIASLALIAVEKYRDSLPTEEPVDSKKKILIPNAIQSDQRYGSTSTQALTTD